MSTYAPDANLRYQEALNGQKEDIPSRRRVVVLSVQF